jgi:hypothetical protein
MAGTQRKFIQKAKTKKTVAIKSFPEIDKKQNDNVGLSIR